VERQRFGIASWVTSLRLVRPIAQAHTAGTTVGCEPASKFCWEGTEHWCNLHIRSACEGEQHEADCVADGCVNAAVGGVAVKTLLPVRVGVCQVGCVHLCLLADTWNESFPFG